MGGAISQIGNAVTQPINDMKKNPGAWIGGAVGTGAGVPGMIGGAGVGSMIQDVFSPGEGPAAPGVDPNLENLRKRKQQNAQAFRANIPNMQKEMGEDLKVSANQGLSAQNKATQEGMSSRGLMYSNINRGAQAANRGRTQAAVAKGTTDINTGLMNAADTLDAQAIETGVGIQQTQQAIQNDIYSQAMARMNAQNSVIGAGLGFLGSAGLTAAGKA